MKRTRVFNIITSNALVIIMLLIMIMPLVRVTLADFEEAGAILYFEQADTTYEQSVEVGTAREDVSLPAQLSAVIRADVDENTTGESTVGGNRDGYIATATSLVAEENTPVSNSISGFFWADGNGDLETDWDGLHNGDEQPLPDYPVKIYNAEDLSTAIAITWTDIDGKYIFENLEPGSYVLGITGESAGGFDFLPPVFITSENKFAIDWSIPGIPAYTEVIGLEDGQAVQDINAGLRLPMGVAVYAASYGESNSIRNLKNAKINDSYFIDNRTWVVMDLMKIDGDLYIHLIMRGSSNSSQKFGDSTNYATSLLRNRLNYFMGDNRIPTIHAMAVKPYLGNHNSVTDRTLPYDPNTVTYLNPDPVPEMAGAETEDILYPPSIADIRKWIGHDRNIPGGHPLHFTLMPGASPFPERFWFRTARGVTNYVYGYFRNTENVLDEGIMYTGTNISDVPAVWINAGAVDRKVNVYHIDSAGNHIGDPNPDVYSVALTFPLADTVFSLTQAHVQSIEGHEYKRWRVGATGPERSETLPVTALSSAEVIAGTDIYLIYEKTAVDITITKRVSGNLANYLKDFTFMIYLADSDEIPLAPGEVFSFDGGTIPETDAIKPPNGTLTLEDGGVAEFTLRHGQTITIKDVQPKLRIIISEVPVEGYQMIYMDSKYSGAFEFDMDYDVVGAVARRFDFLNTRIVVPPMGIESGMWVLVVFPLAAALFIISGVVTIEFLKRKAK